VAVGQKLDRATRRSPAPHARVNVAEAKDTGGVTALMRQYLDVKAQVPDAILFFRLGDFYEMFYEDAVLVAGLLSLTLTSRDKGKEDPVPMCGIPHHASRAYLQRLTDLGHRVAVCEQLEDPRTVKGIVKRGVVRIVTPGVILDEESLDARVPNYVAAVAGETRGGFGLAFIDVTTGDFRATTAANTEALLDEIARIEPREMLVPREESVLSQILRRAYPRLVQTPIKVAGEAPAKSVLAEVLGNGAISPADAERVPLALEAAARVLSYVRTTQVAASLPVSKLVLWQRDDHLIIDEQARAHLELCETMLDRRREGSLLAAIDATRSAVGARLLRRWLLFPLRAVAPIRRRQDAIERLVGRPSAREAARKVLGDIGDIERLASRARLGVATPRDLVALGRSLGCLPALASALKTASEDLPVTEAGEDLLVLGTDLAADLALRLATTLADDAPAATKEGGFIRDGFSAELDRLRQVAAGGRDLIAEIETRERERTGIPSLKVKYNNVFGYYIEITRAKMGQVPSDYVRKQTVANAERFVTAELSDHESSIGAADERRIALECQLFEGLRTDVGAQAARLQALAAKVAAVDVLAALAEVAHRHGYVRPLVDDSVVIDLEEARHPVVERLVGEGGFVPNDLHLDADAEQILLVTGPNMAGKSTVIRQTALAVVLAQMGSFVPARAARIGICDRVFTRVGAGDNLARGESTFLVEMRETAHILRHATRGSLVILDEIGRGTSTYDGVSIAWAVAEFVHDAIGARTLFATHYHELCALSDTHPRVRNVSVAAREWKGDIVFLRKLTPGGASRSFGVDVAKLAGLPADVVARARAILATLEAGRSDRGQPQRVSPDLEPTPQLGLFEARSAAPAVKVAEAPEIAEVLAILRRTEPDDLSPRAALDLVAELRRKLTEAAGRGPS
jgi:DNA mismatch repair protein MutS